MPDEPTQTPIETAWLSFSNAVRLLLVPLPDDRPMDQFLAFRDEVMALVQSPAFLTDLQTAWAAFTDTPKLEVGKALVMELEAFARAVEVARTTATSKKEKKGWFRKLLGKSSTVAGSVKDIIDGLPPLAKGGITLFRQLVDLFAGKR